MDEPDIVVKKHFGLVNRKPLAKYVKSSMGSLLSISITITVMAFGLRG